MKNQSAIKRRLVQRRFVLGTAGHIDHGKTSLVKALTGINTDRLPEEKDRQITIDLGFASLNLGNCLLGIVDVPGHERFVKNMLAGATGIDLAMLVIAADDSIMPQTREHLEILEYMRLPAGVIALTKCDLVEQDWIDLVESEIRELVDGTFLEKSPIVRISGPTGEGIQELRHEIAKATDHHLLQKISSCDTSNVPFRMAIDRTFTVAGHGTVATGCVATGCAKVGDELTLVPQNVPVRVRGLHSHDETVQQVCRGQRAAINLSGVRYDQIDRGECLTTPDSVQPSRRLTVELNLSEQSPRPLKQRGEVRLHLGTLDTLARVHLLGRQPGEGNQHLEPGQTTFAQLFLHQETAAVWGQPFVIRQVSPVETLGGGRILATMAPRIKRLSEPVETRLQDLAGSQPDRRLLAAAYFAGTQDWQPKDSFALSGVDAPESLLNQLQQSGDLRQLPLANGHTRWLHKQVIDDFSGQILRLLDREHQKTPLRTSVERSRITKRLANLDPLTMDGFLNQLADSGCIRIEPKGLAADGWMPQMTDRQRECYQHVINVAKEAGLKPPSISELATELGEPADELIPLQELAVEQQILIRITRGVFLHFEAVQEAKTTLVSIFESHTELTVSEIRESLGISRKLAVPLCEHLDSVSFTARSGDLRRLAPTANRVT